VHFVGFIRVSALISITLMVLGLGLRSVRGDTMYLLRSPGLAFKLHHPPVGRGDAFDVPAVFIAALL